MTGLSQLERGLEMKREIWVEQSTPFWATEFQSREEREAERRRVAWVTRGVMFAFVAMQLIVSMAYVLGE